MHRSTQGGIFSRRNFHLCKVIIATSLIWFIVDVFILTYLTDCSSSVVRKEDCLEKQLRSRSVALRDALKKESVYVDEDEVVGTAEIRVATAAEIRVHTGCHFQSF